MQTRLGKKIYLLDLATRAVVFPRSLIGFGSGRGTAAAHDLLVSLVYIVPVCVIHIYFGTLAMGPRPIFSAGARPS